MDDLDLGATMKGFAVGQKVFHRYSLKRILGRGGMGVVWLARDDTLEIDVALKFLPEVVAMDKEAVRDLKRETRRSLELTHPHIIRIYDFVQDGRAAAISMEYVPGDTLAAMKAERAGRGFEPAELEKWVQQLCEALAYAHERALVVHRDLKPANLMVDAHGDLKIADFGIAASVSDSVSRVSVRAGSSGTPVYMSPQQMMGEKPAVTDDIYSLGATLYDLITGKPPFHSGNIIAQVQGKIPPRMADRRAEFERERGVIPESWERTVAACLAKEPQDRPQRAAEVILRLRQAVVAEPPPLPRAKPAEPKAPPAAASPRPAPPVAPAPPRSTPPATQPVAIVRTPDAPSATPSPAPPPPMPPRPPPPAPPPTPVPPPPAAPAALTSAQASPVSSPAPASPERLSPVAEPAQPAAQAVPLPAAKPSEAATPAPLASAFVPPVATPTPPAAATPAPSRAPAPPSKPAQPKVASSLRYNAGGEPARERPGRKSPAAGYAPAAAAPAPTARRGAMTLAVVAVVLAAIGFGYYFMLHRPAVERAAREAAVGTARSLVSETATAVRAALGARDWVAAEQRLAQLDALGAGLPPEVAEDWSQARAELRGQWEREREAARLGALRVPITVTSTPAGADVVVDGTVRGQTPLAGLELPLGEYGLVLRLRDHAEVSTTLTVAERGQSEWSFPLTRFRGRVQLTGLPAGSVVKVYPIDDAGQAALMPVAEDRLPAHLELPVGAYDVAVTSVGSGPSVTTRSRVVVRRDETVNHHADVRGASVQVNSTPSGATVLLNGRVEGTTPVLLAGQPYGSRQELELRLEGHVPQKRTVQFPASADDSGKLEFVLSPPAGPRLRPDLTKGPARLEVENRARNSLVTRTTVNGQTTQNGPTESSAVSREVFTFAEPGTDGTWRRAQTELVQAGGFQPGTVVQFERGVDRWMPRFVRGGFSAPGVSAEYLYPSYAGLVIAKESLPDGGAEAGRTWEVPLALTRVIVAGSQYESPSGSIRGRVKAVDTAAKPTWAEVEYAFDVNGRMQLPADSAAAGSRAELRGRDVGTLTLRVMLEDGYVSQARLDKRSTIEGTSTPTAGGAATSFVSEIVTTIESTAKPAAAPSSDTTFFTSPIPATDAPSSNAVATPAWDGTIFERNQVDRLPVPVAQAAPKYPITLQRAGVTGSVLVEFVVDATGGVEHVRALESTHRGFEEAALTAVRGWKFRPAQKGGRAVAVRLQLPIGFNLAD